MDNNTPGNNKNNFPNANGNNVPRGNNVRPPRQSQVPPPNRVGNNRPVPAARQVPPRQSVGRVGPQPPQRAPQNRPQMPQARPMPRQSMNGQRPNTPPIPPRAPQNVGRAPIPPKPAQGIRTPINPNLIQNANLNQNVSRPVNNANMAGVRNVGVNELNQNLSNVSQKVPTAQVNQNAARGSLDQESIRPLPQRPQNNVSEILQNDSDAPQSVSQASSITQGEVRAHQDEIVKANETVDSVNLETVQNDNDYIENKENGYVENEASNVTYENVDESANENIDESVDVETEGEVIDFPQDKKSKKEKKIRNQKNKGRSRKKIIGILVAVFVGVIALAGLLYGLSLSNRTYRISFVTGPFEEMEPLTFKDGDLADIADLEDVMSLDEEPKPLVEFTGWYLDEGRTREYTPQRIHEDITLYAGYTLGTVTTEFYMINEYDEDGSYIYLSEVETEYYTGEIDFSSLVDSIMALDSVHYIAAPNVIGYDPVTLSVQGTKSITIEDYVGFLENYFTISTFTRMDDGSYSVYGVESSIPTPNKDSAFYVEFTPNDVTLVFNSNMSSLKGYYDNIGEGSENCVDNTTTTTVKYGDEYVLPSYATISSGVFGEYPEYHSPYGWSIDPNTTIEGGNESLIYEESDTIKIDRRFLSNQTSVELFALWVEGMTPLIIYTELDSTGPTLETSISIGLSRPLEDWTSSFMDDLKRDGYALIGFNTESDLSGEVVSFEDSINGSINTPGYDENRGAIVLYAVYKKIVSQTTIYVLDDEIDRASIDEFLIDSSFFNINLNM